MDKAQAALNLLMDDFFMGEMNAIKQGCLDQFANSKAEDYDTREEAHRKLVAVNDILSHFQAIADGKRMEQKRWKIL